MQVDCKRITRQCCRHGDASNKRLEQAIVDWQVPAQVSDLEIIKRDQADWITASFGHESVGNPEQHIFIPLNRQYVIVVTINSSKLTYSHTPDTYPKQAIEPVKEQIRQEFLSYINVVYSPGILDEIKKQNPSR
ncbi:MAG: hypothetical protein OEY07_05945 [Gammaproteobacteria bacterium]|nr:hypothetical protein [Gammaproteobacteria bacterium]